MGLTRDVFAGTSKYFEVNNMDKPEGWDTEEKKD